MSEHLQRLNEELSCLVDNTRQCLVQIAGSHRGLPTGAGSGVIVGNAGLILTNAHVVRRQQSVEVTLLDGTSYTARQVARDDDHDLALLQIEHSDLPTLELGDSQKVSSGNWVIALGHPWGVRGAATAGVIVGGGRQLPGQPANEHEWLAASLHLRPGHSGGPLVDASGRLLGINTIMAGPDVGLVIPAHVIRVFIEKARSQPTEEASSVTHL